MTKTEKTDGPAVTKPDPATPIPVPDAKPATEVGGRTGPEPTRYGDWERKGIAVGF